MKFIISLIAVAALSFVTSALAQEEESPSPSPEETASATVEDKPSTTISTEEPKAKKEEPPSPKPATEKKEQPAAQKKEQTTAATAAPASGKKMSTEAALKDMENRWAAALGKKDAAAIESMVADDFISVSSKGKIQGRRAMLTEMKRNKDTYTSTKNEKLDVHMYGGGVAVVVGTYREKGTDKDGKAFDRSYRFTDTWMDRRGKWQCVASQVALVAGK